MNNASGLCAEPINPSLINQQRGSDEANHLTLQKGVALPPLEAYGATVTCETGGSVRVIAYLKKG